MTPYLLLLFGTLSLSIAEASSNKLFKSYESITSVGLIFLGYIFSFIYALLAVINLNIPFPQLSPLVIFLVLCVGVLSIYANKLFYQSYKYQEASSALIIQTFTIVLSTILGRYFFSEVISPTQWIGIIFIIMSVFFINLEGKELTNVKELFVFNKATKLTLISSILYSITFAISKGIVQEINPFIYQILDFILVFPIFILLFKSELRPQLPALLTKPLVYIIPTIIFFFYLYNLATFFAYSQNVALPIVDSLNNTVIFFVIMLELFVFKVVHTNLIYKLGVATLAVIGTLLITVFY